MPKDFSQFLSNKANYNDFVPEAKLSDANATDLQMNSMIGYYFLSNNIFQEQDIFRIFLSNTLTTTVLKQIMKKNQSFSLLVAPLTTIHISLQQSVYPHLSKFALGASLDKTKNIVNSAQDLSVQEKKKFELLIKSGAARQSNPFKAPIYTSYFECVRALANQGFLGFFKGYFTGVNSKDQYLINRLVIFDLRQPIKSIMKKAYYGTKRIKQQGSHKVANQIFEFLVLLIAVTVDILANPLMYIQSRFILQNRLPNFKLYKGFRSLFQKNISSPLDFFQGATTHIWKNFFISLFYIPGLFIKSDRFNLIYGLISSAFISYPWLTVIRRLHCQSNLPGMIFPRYSGPWHALRLIFKEEGIKGLYRGFIAYALSTGATSYILFYNQLVGDFEMF